MLDITAPCARPSSSSFIEYQESSLERGCRHASSPEFHQQHWCWTWEFHDWPLQRLVGRHRRLLPARDFILHGYIGYLRYFLHVKVDRTLHNIATILPVGVLHLTIAKQNLVGPLPPAGIEGWKPQTSLQLQREDTLLINGGGDVMAQGDLTGPLGVQRRARAAAALLAKQEEC